MIEDTSKLIPIDQLVVVDNGSSDNTYKVLINLKSQRFKIVVIKNPILSKKDIRLPSLKEHVSATA